MISFTTLQFQVLQILKLSNESPEVSILRFNLTIKNPSKRCTNHEARFFNWYCDCLNSNQALYSLGFKLRLSVTWPRAGFRGEQKADIWGPNLLVLLNQHGQACISKVFPFGAKGAGKEALSKDAISVTWLLVVEICKVGYSRQLLCSFVEATQRSLYLFEFSVLSGFNVAFEGKWHISIQALSGVWWIGLRHVVHLKRASLKPRT